MTDRSLTEHVGPTTSWTYQDQEAAMREGFNSVAEWGLWHAVRDLEELKQRVEVLEAGPNHTPEQPGEVTYEP